MIGEIGPKSPIIIKSIIPGKQTITFDKELSHILLPTTRARKFDHTTLLPRSVVLAQMVTDLPLI